ncbi:MAG: ribokinase [Lachnospiraceae bacterium]|nr:ribokinase [Lachnospiraceae bacterium]
MKVLNFGSLNIDYVYPVDHIILPGETESTGGMNTNCGGKGLNQSIALAKAGVNVYHAGMIGEEGEFLADKCKENGVNTDYIRKVPGRSGHTIIQVDKKGQNCILLFGGANRQITESFIDEVLDSFDKDDMVLLQNEINMPETVIEKAYKKGITIALNPSPFNDGLSKCDLEKVTYFLLNEVEGEQMTGKKDPEKILDTIRNRYPKAKTVLTLGSAGVYYQDSSERCHQGICKVKAVDTTAAGDTFTGYFLAAVTEGLTPKEALRLASKASAIAVTRHGAADSIPEKDEVLRSDLKPEE